MEGARWDENIRSITDSLPKQVRNKQSIIKFNYQSFHSYSIGLYTTSLHIPTNKNFIHIEIPLPLPLPLLFGFSFFVVFGYIMLYISSHHIKSSYRIISYLIVSHHIIFFHSAVHGDTSDAPGSWATQERTKIRRLPLSGVQDSLKKRNPLYYGAFYEFHNVDWDTIEQKRFFE